MVREDRTHGKWKSFIISQLLLVSYFVTMYVVMFYTRSRNCSYTSFFTSPFPENTNLNMKTMSQCCSESSAYQPVVATISTYSNDWVILSKWTNASCSSGNLNLRETPLRWEVFREERCRHQTMLQLLVLGCLTGGEDVDGSMITGNTQQGTVAVEVDTIYCGRLRPSP